jgi:hypothetical protein
MTLLLRKYGLLVFLLLGGCASMNQSECLNADWQMIGLEDGAKGQSLSYIGNHRKACAEYNISPDLEKYQLGHQQGLQKYCTYAKGFNLGSRGSNYNGVCPPELEENFQIGHQRGREIYALTVELKRTEASIKERYSLLDELVLEIASKEDMIISRKTREVERVLLLMEIKEIQAEIDRLEVDIELFEREKSEISSERNLLKQRYQDAPD